MLTRECQTLHTARVSACASHCRSECSMGRIRSLVHIAALTSAHPVISTSSIPGPLSTMAMCCGRGGATGSVGAQSVAGSRAGGMHGGPPAAVVDWPRLDARRTCAVQWPALSEVLRSSTVGRAASGTERRSSCRRTRMRGAAKASGRPHSSTATPSRSSRHGAHEPRLSWERTTWRARQAMSSSSQTSRSCIPGGQKKPIYTREGLKT